MKNVRLFVIVTLFLLSTSLVFWGSRASAATGYTEVTVVEAKTMIDSNPSLVVLDVRNQSEYVTGHIRNAVLIPLFELNSSLDQLNPNDEILAYCKAGARSTTASEILVANGFLHIYLMAGGITAWITEEFPTYVKYSSIQDVVDNATDGSTVYVSSGYYSENLVINKSINLVGENMETAIIDGMSNGTVVYVGSDNVSISDFKLQFSGCSCSYYYGVDVESGRQNISIINNNIFSDSTGILVKKGQDIIIARNNITFSRDYPILIEDSIGVQILKNSVTDNLNQIDIANSTQMVIANNKMMNNGNGGIALTNSNNNTLSGNIIASNSLNGLYLSQSDYNVIVRNSLQSNGRNVYVRNSTDYWDDGFEGNYWSNYTGVDADKDGVGDTPFVLDANNVDHHPLIGLFYSYSATLDNDVWIITDSSVDNFEYVPPNTIRLQVSNATPGQTAGFCRIIIPHALIDPDNGTIQVIIDNNQTLVLFLNTTLYDNGTHRWVYLAYPLSMHEIVIVPEYPVFLVTASATVLVSAALSLVVMIERKKKSKETHGSPVMQPR
jgi:nitrous oxidase accessory protein